MVIFKTKSLTPYQIQQINQLWNEESPLNLKDRFGLLLDGVNDYNHYLIEDIYKNILGETRSSDLKLLFFLMKTLSEKQKYNPLFLSFLIFGTDVAYHK